MKKDFVLLVALATTCFIREARAGDRPEIVEATRRMSVGGALFQQGKFEEARLQYMEACAIVQSEKCFFSLAVVEEKTGHPLDAYQHIQRVMTNGAFMATLDPSFTKIAEATRKQAYAETGHVSVTAPEGWRIVVDGKEAGVAPLKGPLDLAVGLHGVDATIGATSLHEKVEAGAGKLTEVAFVLPVVATGQVVGVVTPVPVGPATGVEQPLKPVPSWNGRRTRGVVIAGVGVAGLVVGGVFAGERAGATSDANTASAQAGAGNSRCVGNAGTSAPCQSLASDLRSNGNDARLEEIFLVSGAVLLGLGIVTTFWPNAPEPPKTGLAPWVGPHVGGMQWAGSF